MLRGHVVLLIAIRPSDEDVKPGGPLGAFREEQAMTRHRVSPSPFLSSSSHNINSYTYSHPNLNFLQIHYTTGAQITLLRGKASVPHPLLWSNEVSLLLQWRTLNACLCTPSAVGAAVSASLLSEHIIRRHSDIVGGSSGRSYAT